ncbi:hypothetical protein [Azospirillum endophyticum]
MTLECANIPISDGAPRQCQDENLRCAAVEPASGAAFTECYDRRTTTNWVDFLSAVEAWITPAAERISAVIDNLTASCVNVKRMTL